MRLFFLCFICCISTVFAFKIPQDTLQGIQQKYGDAALARAKAWEALINDYHHVGELKKLRIVTNFFNQLKASPDEVVWKSRNYWASPLEFLAKGQGDCEDFAIAKYFTLYWLGVAPEKLYFVFVRSKKLSQPHMILAYYETPDADPLILDSQTAWILYASERTDLLPVYSFTDSNVWVNLKNGKKAKVMESKHFPLWENLLKKIEKEFHP